MEKICSTCGILKSINEYHRDISKSDGYRNNCKLCTIHNKDYKARLEEVKDKTCNQCKLVKPIELFIKDDRRPLGFGTICIECARTKLCRGCQVKKDISEFSTSPRSADGYTYQCKECINAKARERYARDSFNRKSSAAKYRNSNDGRRKRKNQNLIDKYGISIEEYESMLAEQEFKCKICDSYGGARGLVVDHCHETGVIRGLLCDCCNRGLGMFKDDGQLLILAAGYLGMHAHFG